MERRDAFLREIREAAAARGLAYREEKSRGRGSHILVHVGDRKSFVPHRPGPGTKRAIRKQLGLD